jgi:DNA-binding protein Fis
MNDRMPMFDDPIPPVEKPPKKPRQKPTRAAPKPVKKRRKRRTVKPAKVEQHNNGRYPKHVYDLVGKLMNLELPLRNFVMEVTKALTNERPS